MRYGAKKIEQKWQKIWESKKLYEIDLNSKKPKFYCLVMFPYPSGDKLHIGHWYNFAPVDSYARFMRMQGFNVFEPMGYDAFGLPAENYAIKTGVAPKESTEKNISYMRQQLGRIGTMYDWSKEVNTSHPDYYKWTQWVFLELFKKGLAYRKEAPVNWCGSCQTVLANEQVKEGLCERCDTTVIQKDLTQWFFKITDYAEDLLNHRGLEWPEKTLAMQVHWIGRKEGINIDYEIEGADKKISVFTTRPDTNFGATFIVVAPDSLFVTENLDVFPKKKEVKAYVDETAKKTELERMSEGRKKTGVFTGWYAVNNLNGRKMPIYVGDFVLATVGTGNVVGVPGHDLRDFEFAKAMGLDVIRVVIGPDGDKSEITRPEQVQEEEGVMVNSDFLDGMNIHKATVKIMDHLEEKGWGKRVVIYRLRDWLLSRQRYWGAPIPIVRCKKCGDVPVPEKDLPVLLPEKDVDYKPKGKAPLASVDSFVKTKCPKCGGSAEREVDTMDTFVDSSWYFLRYLDSHDEARPFDPAINKKWMPVDMYVGGPEHACMHLLYARFIHKALMNDRKAEPFKRLVHQGLITKDGAKMSKSKGNVVSPDEFVEKYGSDVFRMYMMFMGPFTEGGDWNDRGITGIARFADRAWNLVAGKHAAKDTEELTRRLHGTIKKVTEDIQAFHFNTALAAMMELVNLAYKDGMSLSAKKLFVQILAPFAPHLAEESWEYLYVIASGAKQSIPSIFDAGWPKFDAKYLKADTFELVIQVNGKVRARAKADIGISKEDAVKLALQQASVQVHTKDKKRLKEIFVPDKLVNIVVN
ncbi:leucine--tRNA ligase [Candidatus Peregrinibacteria bacterium]|nr:leucine--tRNA ligase [Candidatus Peregrinibacteria bacterium]